MMKELRPSSRNIFPALTLWLELHLLIKVRMKFPR